MLKEFYPSLSTVTPASTATTTALGMRPPISPTRRSSRSDEWVIVGNEFETGSHTKSRSPQLNDDNMPSGQVANASSNSAAAALLSAICDAGFSNAATHKPESNGSSTETAGTDDTMMGNNATGCRSQHSVSATYPPSLPLTQFTLEMHEREQSQLYVASVSGWVVGAGMGHRLSMGFPRNTACSTFFTGSSSMSPTTMGSSTIPAQEWMFVGHPLATDDQVASAGAWCNAPMDASVCALSRISLNSE